MDVDTALLRAYDLGMDEASTIFGPRKTTSSRHELPERVFHMNSGRRLRQPRGGGLAAGSPAPRRAP
jgi:hypothetical protein